MTEFKVGDEVIAVKIHDETVPEGIGIVIETSHIGGVVVDFKDWEDGWDNDRGNTHCWGYGPETQECLKHVNITWKERMKRG